MNKKTFRVENINEDETVTGSVWIPVKDGDPRALAIMKRHYSWHAYKDGRPHRLFVGPGEKMVLLLSTCDALFVWRKFRSKDNQYGINCAVFRNESVVMLASSLVLAAEDMAWARWPGQRLYTYVNPKKIRSTNPGYCFLKAGWKRCGTTKRLRLVILEKTTR